MKTRIVDWMTDEQLSMVATAVAASIENDGAHTLCCAADALAACVQIVGDPHAAELHGFIYNALGCVREGEEARLAEYIYRIAGWEWGECSDVIEEMFEGKDGSY